jgi:hypothetical protein
MPTDSEALMQLVQKVDQLIHDLPERYVDQRSNEARHIASERRIDNNEADIKQIKQEIASLHDGSMKYLESALKELERRILDKIEANTKSSQSNWLTIAIAVVGWLVAIGGLLVAIFK